MALKFCFTTNTYETDTSLYLSFDTFSFTHFDPLIPINANPILYFTFNTSSEPNFKNHYFANGDKLAEQSSEVVAATI